jgi:hypothetical protein
MRTFYKSAFLPLVAMAIAPTAASAQGLLDSLPKISVGNGAPITGTNGSQAGVGILTPQVNGTPISVRVLGKEKVLGVYVKNSALGDKPVHLELNSPIDGKLNGLLPK